MLGRFLAYSGEDQQQLAHVAFYHLPGNDNSFKIDRISDLMEFTVWVVAKITKDDKGDACCIIVTEEILGKRTAGKLNLAAGRQVCGEEECQEKKHIFRRLSTIEGKK